MNENLIQNSIDNSFLFGCLKYKEKITFYLMPLANWILNYSMYDPDYNPDDWKDTPPFRNNILNVSEDNIELFVDAIEIDKIDVNKIILEKFNLRDIFLFYVDFDSKIFISHFDDIDIEEYLPDDNWVGKFDDPVNYLPQDLVLKLFS